MIWPIFIAVLLLDQLSKALILKTLSLNQSIPVIPSIFHITLVANTGVAFGLFKESAGIFVWVGLVTLFWIYHFIRSHRLEDGTLLTALGLVSGGALGNLIDRFRYGHVVDFLDFRIWPVFNVADLCISIGTVLLCINCFKK